MRNWDLAAQAEKDEELLKCMLDPIYFINNHAVAFNVVSQKFDRIQCFPYQENVIEQYLDHAFNIILKSRQCLPKDTFVDTPTGPRKIQDMREGDAVFSYNLKEQRMEVDRVYDAWCSGDRQCVKFKLQDTRNFEVGENHPFYVKGKGFVKAKDIVRGDEILNDNIGFGELSPSDSEVKLLAYLITDGTTKRQVKFTNNNPEYLAEFEESVNGMFPSLHVSHIPKLKGYDYMPAQKHGTSTMNPVMEWCGSKNIAGKLSAEKLLPEEVFQWSKKSVALLINRMFAGDGWISIMKKSAAKRVELGIASPNLEFMHQVKSLLNKFGIRSNVYEVKNMKLQKNRFFKLRVTHSKSVARFIHQIGIYGKVRQEHLDIIRNGKHNVKEGAIVKKTEVTRILKCYDISVEKNENFFVDGLLTHNTGISVITAAYVAWRIMFKSNERVLIMANNAVGAKRFLSYVKSFITNTPRFLKPKGGDDNGSVKWNDTRIDMANMSWAMALAASAQAGRGENLSLVVLDEFAFVEKDKSIWTAISPALSMSQGDCIMISTPFGSGNVFHEYWVAAEKRKSSFNSIRVHWSENPFCARGLRHVEENGKLILWSPWYEEQRQQFNYDSVKIAQELDLSFLGSKLLAVDEMIVNKYKERLDNEKVKPIAYLNYQMKAFTEKEGDFWVWKRPEPSGSYILSADVARGDGNDYSAIQILDVNSLEQVAEYQGKIDPDMFADVIQAAGLMYNEAYLVVECNSMGLATTYKLERRLKYNPKRMFHSKSFKKMHVRPTDYDDFAVEQGSQIPGFQTTFQSKVMVVDAIRTAMREEAVKINSPRLMNEFNTWVMETKQERVTAEAEPGYNDDLIMALGIGLYIRQTEYSNLSISNNMMKAMLDAFTVSASPMYGKQLTKEEKIADDKERKESFEKQSGLFFFRDGNSMDEDDPNDTSWLIG